VGRIGGAAAAIAISISILLAATDARAFELDGHEIIEAAAYKRLLALELVPGAGAPAVSGRALLAVLIADGVLDQPPCFDRDHPRGDCGTEQRLDLPLLYWPRLHAGAPDLVLDRQLGQQGQCQHFMANTHDGLTPIDPASGVPAALVTEAYQRCVRVAGAVFDLILRDPQLAQWRLAGTYVLMHAIQDSYSAAHVNRTPRLEIVHLLSWTLIDWPCYVLGGRTSFPRETHHEVTDRRDADFLRWDARAADGRACRDFHNPYAVPEECLTERGRAAVGAVVDMLVAIYAQRAQARAAGRPPTLFSSSGDEARAWRGFVREHLPSVSTPALLPTEPHAPLRRSDVFVGVQALAGNHALGGGLWGAKLFIGPAAPFVLGLTGGFGYTRGDGTGQLAAGLTLGLLLPLVRRFSIGASPIGVRVACDTHLDGCAADAVAGLGVVLIPLSDATWLGVTGPDWSWTDRAIGRSWFGLAFGWSHERVRRRDSPAPDAIAAWDPPRVDEVHAFRSARSTRAIYVAATMVSRPENAFGGFGLEWRLDRDAWDRRAGISPGLQLEIDGGRVEQNEPGGGVAIAPTLRAYLLPSRFAVSATPALVRAGAIAERAFTVDVAARAGIVLEVGRLELAVDSPPVSYVSGARIHPLPITVRLGFQLD
jgi:hypothetical protein